MKKIKKYKANNLVPFQIFQKGDKYKYTCIKTTHTGLPIICLNSSTRFVFQRWNYNSSFPGPLAEC